jgi:tetratricopeptide (TPR) repeat protein
MPSHIYVLIGDYARAIDSNLRGIAADETYMRVTGRTGGFHLVYRLHNMQFVVYAAMFAGQYELAMAHVEMIERNVPLELIATLGDFIEATYAIRLQVYVRFGKWDLLKHLTIPEDQQLFPITTAFTYWARAVAYSATRDVDAAERERGKYLEAVEKVPEGRLMFPNTARQVLAIGTSFLDGELDYRKGEYDTAFAHLEESIKRYDSLVYCEPWSWMTPPRHAYAALSLEQGHITRALETYYADLGFSPALARAHQHPNNIWALAGVEECLRLLGREEERRIVEVLLRTGRAVADVEVGVSCFCRIDKLPGDGEKESKVEEEKVCCNA